MTLRAGRLDVGPEERQANDVVLGLDDALMTEN
jgi:hypothetical protein